MNYVAIFITAYVASVLAGLSGIGGGGMLIPLFVLLGDVEIKEAIVLSIVTIVGSSLIRSLFYFTRKQRSAKNRFLPDYSVIKLVVPFDGNTAYLGFVLNEVLPNYVIIAGIVIILGVLTFKTFKKALDYCRKKETKDYIFIFVDNIEVKVDPDEENVSSESEEENVRPGETWRDVRDYLLYIAFEFGILGFFTFMRNSSDYPWAIYAAQFVIIMLFNYMSIRHTQSTYKFRKIQKFNFVEGDIEWSKPSSFVKYALSASCVGFLSTMLGIGGGMIMNPIMINLKMLPEVVVATSSLTSFFSATISASQFIVTDGFEWYYGVLMAIGGLAAGTSLLILNLVKKKIKVVITVLLAITLSISMIMLVVVNIIDIATDSDSLSSS